jgi:GH25 family lysozyme M1 (1,4-beta-N-acetylmuramidase)/5-hydroxyisourate hydrolase-like protein (transthyretin family)
MRRALLSPTLLCLTLLLTPLVQSPSAGAAEDQPRGLDVAKYQHPNGAVIDWPAAKRGGVSFVYVKAVEGTTYTNPWYADDAPRARASGLQVGAYDFARPQLPLSTALDQANYFLRTIGEQRRSLTLPPALDLEVTGGLSRGDLTAWAQLWLDEVHARTGRRPVLYSYPYFLDHAVYGPALVNASLWIATYGHAVATPIPGDFTDYRSWQDSASGRYPGISAAVDTDVFSGTSDELAAFGDGTRSASWPTALPDAPVGVSLTQKRRGSVTLSWLPGNDGGYKTTGWEVVRSDGVTVSVPVGRTPTTLSGLSTDQSYTVTMRALNTRGRGADSGTSNAALPLGPTSLSLQPGSGTAYGPPVTATGRLIDRDSGAGIRGAAVQVQQRTGSTWSTVATVRTANDGTWRWSSTVTASQVLRAVFTTADGYASSSSPEALRAIRPALSISAPTQVRPGRTWNVAAAVRPTERRVVRLLVMLGGRFTVVSSATTDSRGVVHLAWREAQAGNRTVRLQVGAAPSTTGSITRLDVRVR